MKKKPILGKLIKKTAGGHHGWYEAYVDDKKIIIRKPLKK